MSLSYLPQPLAFCFYCFIHKAYLQTLSQRFSEPGKILIVPSDV